MSSGDCNHTKSECSCEGAVSNASVHQTLEEMDFERSIWQAAIDNNVPKIKHMIQHQNVNPNTTDIYGYTPLHYAARNGAMDAAVYLLDSGANINCRTGSLGATPLHRAVTANKVEMVSFLLKRGAFCSVKDNDGLTAYDRAALENKTVLLQIFDSVMRQHDE